MAGVLPTSSITPRPRIPQPLPVSEVGQYGPRPPGREQASPIPPSPQPPPQAGHPLLPESPVWRVVHPADAAGDPGLSRIVIYVLGLLG